MNDYDTFLDLFGKWCKMAKDGKEHSEEAKLLLWSAIDIYNKFSDEQQFEVDEYILRMRLWFGV